MSTLHSIIISIITSFIASFMFWLLSYVLTGTKVVFSDCIEKQKLKDKKGYRYRIKVMNCGWRDLFEVSFSVRLVIFNGTRLQTTYLGFGENISRPVLKGRDWDEERIYGTYLPEIEINEITLREFKKEAYPEHIRKKAKDGSLTIEDLFEEYSGSIYIQAFAFGNDAKTGARKIFRSEKYKGFTEGKFVVWMGPEKKIYKFFLPKSKAIEAVSRINTIGSQEVTQEDS